MAGLALDETTEDQTRPPVKRKGFLSRVFSGAVSLGVGFGIGMATRTCATVLLCTAGAPAVTTAVTAMAASGLVLGLYHSYKGYRREKEIFRDTKFLSKQTLATTLTHTSLSLAGGWLAMSFGDVIGEKLAEGYGYASDFLGLGPELPQPDAMVELPVQPEAPVTQEAPVFENAPSIDDPIIAETVDQPVLQPAPEVTDNGDIDTTTAPPPPEPAPLETANFEVMTESPVLTSPDIQDISVLPEGTSLSFSSDSFNYVSTPETLMEPPQIAALPEIGTPIEYTISAGDNMWDVIEEHYGLNSNADIQRYVDAIAVFNGMEGVTANHLDIGDTVMLPEFGYVETTEQLQLDWHAIDADAAKMRLG